MLSDRKTRSAVQRGEEEGNKTSGMERCQQLLGRVSARGAAAGIRGDTGTTGLCSSRVGKPSLDTPLYPTHAHQQAAYTALRFASRRRRVSAAQRGVWCSSGAGWSSQLLLGICVTGQPRSGHGRVSAQVERGVLRVVVRRREPSTVLADQQRLRHGEQGGVQPQR